LKKETTTLADDSTKKKATSKSDPPAEGRLPDQNRESGDKETRKTNVDLDVFVLDKQYPDPAELFAFKPRSLQKIKDEAIVVLDTNVLLVPYRTTKESLKEIGDTYTALAKAKRLAIPGQVAREFAKNRPEQLKNVYQQLSQGRGVIKLPAKPSYPLLTSSALYDTVREVHSQLEAKAEEYRDAVGKLLNEIEGWHWNDPVSELYRGIFTKEVIVPLEHDEKKTVAQWEHRRGHNIPPGYKDSSKPDMGIGDFLIWQTILGIGHSKNADVIFVSGEEKSDWRLQSDNRSLWPRFELVEEYRRETNGRTLHMIGLGDLLQLFGVKPEIVQEVRREEETITRPQAHRVPRFSRWFRPSARALLAISEYLGPQNVRLNESFPTFLSVTDTGIGYEVLEPRKAGNIIGLLRLTFHDLNVLAGQLRELTVFFIRQSSAHWLRQEFVRFGPSAFKLIVGTISSDGKFIPDPELS